MSRHARASQVSLSLIAVNGEVCLEVNDDGVGFDLNELSRRARRASLGHAGMRERVDLVGGRLQIRSGRGRGTTVVAFVPVKGDAA